MTFNPREEEFIRLLTEPQNRAILTILDDAPEPLTVAELAERIVERGTPILRSEEYENERKQTCLTLHHHYLPELADAGIVEYDRNEGVVAPRDAGAATADWVGIEQIDDLLSRVQCQTPPTDKIGVLTGHENILEYGATLVNGATEELFFLYVTDDLLTESCISCEQEALERGVDVFIGSPDPAVRERCRTHLSDATIWEPQYDWMNLTSSYPKVGRLVFADRTNLMVGLVEEPAGNGTVSETVMIGEGKDNPLVVLVRELLGPRLDHLDFQSTEFGDHLPSER